MADGLDRLIASLDASFEAAVARAEDEAASDLAFSLSQDRELSSAAARLGPLELLLSDGTSCAVARIGSDFFGAGEPLEVLVPASRALLREGSEGGPSPVRSGDLARTVLLRWARLGALVEVMGAPRSVRGRLTRASRDHVEVLASRGRYLVAWEEISSVRRVPEGSTGAA